MHEDDLMLVLLLIYHLLPLALLLLDYVSETEKAWLFLNSSLLISTSSIEGFGIPILDIKDYKFIETCTDTELEHLISKSYDISLKHIDEYFEY